MPLRLDIKKKLSARSDRVKSVDFHPTEPWVLSGLYSGNVFIWDYNTQALEEHRGLKAAHSVCEVRHSQAVDYRWM